MADSKGMRRYSKAPAIKSKPAMKESGGDKEESATPKKESTKDAPRPESGTGGAQPSGSVTSGTDGIEVHSDADAASGMHERHMKEAKEMGERHVKEAEAMHERHLDDHKKMHKRHHEERKAGMTEDYAEQATAAGSMGVTAGQ